MWKAAFSGRSERSERSEAGSVAGGRKKKSRSGAESVISTSSRKTYDDDEERRRRRSTRGNSVYGDDDAASSYGTKSRGGGLTEGAIRALNDNNDDDWEDDDKYARSEKKSRSGDGRERRRKSTRSEKTRSRSRSRSRDRKDDSKRRGSRKESDRSDVDRRDSGRRDSEKSRGKARADPGLEENGSTSRALPPMGSFDQFPGQFPAEPPQPYPVMSGALPSAPDNQFYGQPVPPAPRPGAVPNRTDSYGHASGYYVDEGQSVGYQPGMRPHSPNMLVNPDAHLATPSAAPQPVQDTGHGAAADYYSAAPMTAEPESYTPSGSSKPDNRPRPNTGSQSSRPSKNDNKTSSSGSASGTPAKIAAAAMASAAAASGTPSRRRKDEERRDEERISTYQQTSSYSEFTEGRTNTDSRPQQPFNGPGSQYGTPQQPVYYGPQTQAQAQAQGAGKPPSHSNVPLYAAGAAAAGLAAYELHEHNQHSAQQSNTNSDYGNGTQGQTRPPVTPMGPGRPMNGGGNVGYQQQQPFHEHRGPITRIKDGILDLVSTPEDVRRMEDYTEYIGVCKYCFDPRTSPNEAPRRHHHHRNRDSFENLRSRRSIERMRRRGSNDSLRKSGSTRIDKESRYYNVEESKRRRSGEGVLGAGLAAAGLAAGANALFNDGKDFNDTYSVKSGHRERSAARRRSRSSSREKRRRASYGVTSKGREEEWVTVRTKDGKIEKRRVRHKSRSTSRDRRSNGLFGAAAGAALGVGVASAAARGSKRRQSPRAQGAFVRRHSRSSSSSRSRSPGLADILGFSNSKTTKRNGRKSPTNSYYDISRRSRPAESDGFFGGFFASPQRGRTARRGSKERRKKKTGFFGFSNSSVSSDDGIAFGEGFASRTSLSLGKKPSRKSSDERIAETIAGIGATAAAIEAAKKGRIGKRNNRQELRKRVDDSSRRYQQSAQATGPDEDGWEDELPSDGEASSSGDSALAFGDSRLSKRNSLESVSSGDGLSAWGWRWGGKDKKKKRRSSSLSEYQTIHQDAAFDTRPSYPDSREASSTNVPTQPLQYVDPQPLPDDSRHGSMPGAFDDAPVVRPGPGPIQQPKPVSPKRAAFVKNSPDTNDRFSSRPTPTRTQSSPTRSNFAEDAALIGGAALVTAGIIAGQNRKPKESSNVRFGLTEEQQRKEDREQSRKQERERRRESERADDERRRADRTRALKEEAERNAREQDAQRREEEVRQRREDENRRAAEAELERRKEDDRLEDERRRRSREQQEREAKNAEDTSKSETARRSDRERSSRKRHEHEGDADFELDRKRQEFEDSNGYDIERREEYRRDDRSRSDEKKSSQSSNKWGSVVAGAAAAATVGAVAAGYEHEKSKKREEEREEERRGYDDAYVAKHVTPDDTTSGTPLADDDIFDRDFFKRKRSDSDFARESRQAEIAQKAADKVIADLETRYQEPAQSQADFFVPKDLHDEAAEEKTKWTGPNADNDIQVYRAEVRTPSGQPGYIVPPGKNRHAPYGVPGLSIISPTPPPSIAGSVKGKGSRSSSPLARAVEVDPSTPADAEIKESRRKSVNWGDDEINVYQEQTPEPVHEEDSYMTARDGAPKTSSKLDEVVVEESHPRSGTKTTTYREEDLSKTDHDRVNNEPPQVPPLYRQPFYDSVSDIGIAVDSPGTEGAPPVQGFVEGEVKDTPSSEKTPHIPGGFDDQVYEDKTGVPAEEPNTPAWEPPLSKKEQKKREKAAKRASLVDSEPDSPAVDPEPSTRDISAEPETSEWTPPLSKKDKKKKDKEAKRNSLIRSEPSIPAVEPEPEAPLPEASLPEAPVEQETTEWEPPLSKKDKKKREKAAKRSSTLDSEADAAIIEPEPTEAPVVEQDESAWEPPLSKKEQKKREKAAKRGETFENETATPSVEREIEVPQETPVVQEESTFAEPLSKKEKKKLGKVAQLAEAFESDSSRSMGEEATSRDASVDRKPIEDAWEPPLSKKEQKKREKAAKRASLMESEPEPSATEQAEVVQEPETVEEPAWEPPLSKKEKKKREKELKRNSMAGDSVGGSSPPPEPNDEMAEEEAKFFAMERSMEEDKPAEEPAWEPPLSKKEKKKREKELKRNSMAGDSVGGSSPPPEMNDEMADEEAKFFAMEQAMEENKPFEDVAPKLSKKEQKKADKEAKKSGFGDVAAALMTAGGLTALASTSDDKDNDSSSSSGKKKSKKGKKKLGEPETDRDIRDIEPANDPPNEPSSMPGGWDSDSRDSESDQKSKAVDPFQFQIKDDEPSKDVQSPTEADPWSQPSDKKSKKKKKRDSGLFNEPSASSPLRTEWKHDDYMGGEPSNSQVQQEDSLADGTKTNGDDGLSRFGDDPRVTDSPRRMSPEDGRRMSKEERRSRSAASEPGTDVQTKRSSTIRVVKAASEVGYSEEPESYDGRPPLAASESVDPYERVENIRRRSKIDDDDDNASVVSSRSRKSRDESASGKKEKKGGFFGLFSRKSVDTGKPDGAPLSRQSTRESREDEEEGGERRRRHKHRESSLGGEDGDDTRSTSGSRHRHHRSRDGREDDARSTTSESRHRRGEDDSRERRRSSKYGDDYYDDTRSESGRRHRPRDRDDGHTSDSKDQSFLGIRVEDLPPLPVSPPESPAFAPLNEEQGDGNPASAKPDTPELVLEPVKSLEATSSEDPKQGPVPDQDKSSSSLDEALQTGSVAKLDWADEVENPSELPFSLPTSPSAQFETPQRPGGPPRASTAVPLRFPFGSVPRTERSASRTERSTSFGSPSVTSSPQSPGSQKKKSRPSSTEFKPLYLVEKNRKPTAEVEQTLPSLPSSKPSSRSSSINGSEVWHSAAEDPGSPESSRELKIDINRANAPHRESDLLNSTETTPKASDFPPTALHRPTRGEPQFYTWEDFAQDERLHEQHDNDNSRAFGEPLPKQDYFNFPGAEELPTLPASRPESPTEHKDGHTPTHSALKEGVAAVAGVVGAAAISEAVFGGHQDEKHRSDTSKDVEDRASSSAVESSAIFETPLPRKASKKKKGKKGKKQVDDDEAFAVPADEPVQPELAEASHDQALSTVEQLEESVALESTGESVNPTEKSIADDIAPDTGDVMPSDDVKTDDTPFLSRKQSKKDKKKKKAMSWAVFEEENVPAEPSNAVDSAADASNDVTKFEVAEEPLDKTEVVTMPEPPIAHERLVEPSAAQEDVIRASSPKPEEEKPETIDEFAPTLSRKLSKKAKKKQKAAAWQSFDDTPAESNPDEKGQDATEASSAEKSSDLALEATATPTTPESNDLKPSEHIEQPADSTKDESSKQIDESEPAEPVPVEEWPTFSTKQSKKDKKKKRKSQVQWSDEPSLGNETTSLQDAATGLAAGAGIIGAAALGEAITHPSTEPSDKADAPESFPLPPAEDDELVHPKDDTEIDSTEMAASKDSSDSKTIVDPVDPEYHAPRSPDQPMHPRGDVLFPENEVSQIALDENISESAQPVPLDIDSHMQDRQLDMSMPETMTEQLLGENHPTEAVEQSDRPRSASISMEPEQIGQSLEMPSITEEQPDEFSWAPATKKGKKGKKGKKAAMETSEAEPIQTPTTVEPTAEIAIEDAPTAEPTDSLDADNEGSGVQQEPEDSELLWAMPSKKKGKKGKKSKVETPLPSHEEESQDNTVDSERGRDGIEPPPVSAVVDSAAITAEADMQQQPEPAEELQDSTDLWDAVPLKKKKGKKGKKSIGDSGLEASGTPPSEETPITESADTIAPADALVVDANGINEEASSKELPQETPHDSIETPTVDDEWSFKPSKKKGKKGKRASIATSFEDNDPAPSLEPTTSADKESENPSLVEDKPVTEALSDPSTSVAAEDEWAVPISKKKGKKGKRSSLATSFDALEPVDDVKPIAETVTIDPKPNDNKDFPEESAAAEQMVIDENQAIEIKPTLVSSTESTAESELPHSVSEPPMSANETTDQTERSVDEVAKEPLAGVDETVSRDADFPHDKEVPLDDLRVEESASTDPQLGASPIEDDEWAPQTSKKKSKKNKKSKAFSWDAAEPDPTVTETPPSIEEASASIEQSNDFSNVDNETTPQPATEGEATDDFGFASVGKKKKKGKKNKSISWEPEPEPEPAVEAEPDLAISSASHDNPEAPEPEVLDPKPSEQLAPETDATDDWLNASAVGKKKKKGKKGKLVQWEPEPETPVETTLASQDVDETSPEEPREPESLPGIERDVRPLADNKDTIMHEVQDEHASDIPAATKELEAGEHVTESPALQETQPGDALQQSEQPAGPSADVKEAQAAEPEEEFSFSTKKSKKDKKKAKKNRLSSDPWAEPTADESLPGLEPQEADQQFVPAAETDAIAADSKPDESQFPLEADKPEPSTGEDEFISTSKQSKKDKKKAKKSRLSADPWTDDTPAETTTMQTDSKDDSMMIDNSADGTSATAQETAQQDDEWSGFSTKKSKKDKKKAKRQSEAFMEEPSTVKEESISTDLPLPGPLDVEMPDADNKTTQELGTQPDQIATDLDNDLGNESADRQLGAQSTIMPSTGENEADSESHVINKDLETSQRSDPSRDLEFAATLAAGLADSGFDPSLVVNDPTFHRRGSPPGAIAEADPEEFFAPVKNKKGKKGKKNRNSSGLGDETPVSDSVQPEKTSSDDFDAIISQGLTGTGFDPKLLEQATSSSKEASSAEVEGDASDFGYSMQKKKKGKKGKKSAFVDFTAEDPVIENPPVPNEAELPLERETVLPSSDAIPAALPEDNAMETSKDSTALDAPADNSREMDVDGTGFGISKKKEKRNKKKQQRAEAALAQEIHAPVEAGLPSTAEEPKDVATNQAKSPESESSTGTSRIQSLFPGLQRVKYRKPSPTNSEDAERRRRLSSNSGPEGFLHTSEVSQSLPVAVGSESQSGERHSAAEGIAVGAAAAAAAIGLGMASQSHDKAHENDWSFASLDENDKQTPHPPPHMRREEHEIVRDSGYQEGDSTPIEAMEITERDTPQIRTTQSRESLRSRRSASPLHIATDTGPSWNLNAPRQREEDVSSKLHVRTPSREIAQTPLQSTTKDRASPLFRSGEDSNTADISRQQTAESDRSGFSPQIVSPSNARSALESITEENHPPKRAKGPADLGGPEHIKALDRNETPQGMRRTIRERPSLSGALLGSRSVSNQVSTEELLDRLASPAMEEDGDRIRPLRHRSSKRRVSDQRPPSAMSNQSGFNSSQLRSPIDDLRSFSRTSNRSSTPTLRRIDRSMSGDLRAASRRGSGSAVGARSPITIPFEPPPTPPSNDDDVVHASAVRTADMDDVFQGYGGAQKSELSPTRPPGVRKRKSMHGVEMNALVDENRSLQDARDQMGRSRMSMDFDQNSMRATIEARDLELREKDAEINQIRAMLQPLQGEIDRLKQINGDLTEANRNLVDDANGRYGTLQSEHAHAHEQWQSAARELETTRSDHEKLTSTMRETIEAATANALADKNAEILRLREELDVATEQIRALQVQIQSSRKSDFLTIRDEDYFDGSCQKLCQHVQQWVLRFSKLSDNRVSRLSDEIKDEKIELRLDNAILDGSDVDKLLSDRIRRRDVFMSVVMTMVWEYVFTRYLFGMDREQRQKLKALEKILAEVGPPRAVAQWRATTLTLLSKRPDFATQCQMDTEAVAHEIFEVLCALLPPPSNTRQQLLTSLQKVIGLSVDISIEMRTQRAEFIMLPPLQPEYDTNGDLVRKVHFNASLMNERSGMFSSNGELEQQRAVVKIVLFPLVVKKGDESGEGEEEIVVCPAQVLVHNDGGRGKKVVRVMSGAMEIDDPRRSRMSLVSTAGESMTL